MYELAERCTWTGAAVRSSGWLGSRGVWPLYERLWYGFPLLDRQRAGQEALPSLSEEDLLGGADAIIDCCAAAHARKLPPR